MKLLTLRNHRRRLLAITATLWGLSAPAVAQLAAPDAPSVARQAQWGDPPVQRVALTPAPVPTPPVMSPAPAAVTALASTAASMPALVPVAADRVLRLDSLGELLSLPPLLQLKPLDKPGAAVWSAAARAPLEAPMSLVDSARYGLAQSMDVEAARQRLIAFDAAQVSARGAWLPQADMRISEGRGRLETATPPTGMPRRETTATIRQAVVDEGARFEQRRAGSLVNSGERQWLNAVSGNLLESAGAWLAVVQARVAVHLGAEYETLLQELSEYIARREAAGGASPADRERVRARVSNIRASLADGDAGLKSAQRNLERLTGLSPRALTLAFGSTVLRVPQDRDAAAELALNQNAELAASRIEIEAAEDDRKAQRGRLLPKLAVELSHATSTNAGGTEGKIRENRAMLVFSAQLYNGGSNWAQVDAAAARRDELAAKATNVERKLVQELEVAYANLDASAVRFAAVRDELDANTKVVTAFRKQLLGANRQLLDVLDAYQRLYQSRLDMTQALISEAQSQLRVAHLTGTLNQLVPGSAELPSRVSPPALPQEWQPWIPDLAPKGPVLPSAMGPDIQVPGR